MKPLCLVGIICAIFAVMFNLMFFILRRKWMGFIGIFALLSTIFILLYVTQLSS